MKALIELAAQACDLARTLGATDVAATASRGSSRKIVIRDGEVEELKSSQSQGLSLRLYVDGRYGTHWTSETEPERLRPFLEQAIALTRLLAEDTHRALPDPKWYDGRATGDLGCFDATWSESTADARRARAMAAHDAGRAEVGKRGISVSATATDNMSASALVTTNGFSDAERSTSFWVSASVTAQDESGRKPMDWAVAGTRQRAGADGLSPKAIGVEAAERALAQLGADDIETVTLPVVVENRAVGKLLGGLLRPLAGSLIDQKRSCLEASVDTAIASPILTLRDEPHLPGAWGTTRYDGEGLTTRRRPIIEKGVLKTLLINTYYGRKLARPITGAATTNLIFDSAGARPLDAILADLGDAILITGFLGGNTNTTTGAFSHGLRGFLVRGGKRVRPIASMNLAGNHTELWKTLTHLGDDPYLYGSTRAPSLAFGPITVAGR